MSPHLALLTLNPVTDTRQKQHEIPETAPDVATSGSTHTKYRDWYKTEKHEIPETPPDVASSGSTHTKYRDWYKTQATLDSRDTP